MTISSLSTQGQRQRVRACCLVEV